MALMIIVVQSLGMGLDAPWGRIVAITYTAKTKRIIKCQKKYMWMLCIPKKHVLLS